VSEERALRQAHVLGDLSGCDFGRIGRGREVNDRLHGHIAALGGGEVLACHAGHNTEKKVIGH
jgi:hypothetical protein